jgi:hypothetical protein
MFLPFNVLCLRSFSSSDTFWLTVVTLLLQLGEVYTEAVKGFTIGLAVNYMDRLLVDLRLDHDVRCSMHLPLVSFLIACKVRPPFSSSQIPGL